MPVLIDNSARAHEVVDAVVHLIATRGLEAVSIRNIAEVVRVRPSTLTGYLTNTARILHLTTGLVARRIESEIASTRSRRGVLGFLPEEDSLERRRAWLALVELARSHDDLAAVVRKVEGDRRRLLRYVVGRPVDDLTIDAVLATVDGLTAAMCARIDPVPLARAETVLEQVCSALGCPVDGPCSPA